MTTPPGVVVVGEGPEGLGPEPDARAQAVRGVGVEGHRYDTRRLVFLKAVALVDLVRALDRHASPRAAVDALVDAPARPAFLTALASLAESGVVEPVHATLRETA